MRWDEKKRKKNFSPKFCSYTTREENSKKKKSKKILKIKKIKKVNTGVISIQNGLREAEKERKKIYSRIPFIVDPGKKIPKKIAKKFKKLKNLFPELFLAKTRWDRPRKQEKNFSPEFRSYTTRVRKFRKKKQKNSKN